MDDLIAEAFAFVLFIALVCLYAIPIWWLWNDLMPVLFGLKEISFWQSIEMSLLSGLLLKSKSSTKETE